MSAVSTNTLQRIKRRTYEILEGSVVDRASHACEIFIASLVVANVVAIILESVHSIHEAYEAYFHIFDLVSVMVFSLEYVLRVCRRRRLRRHGHRRRDFPDLAGGRGASGSALDPDAGLGHRRHSAGSLGLSVAGVTPSVTSQGVDNER